MWRRRTQLGLALAALALGLLLWAARGIGRDLATPRSLHTTAYVGSQECTRCHPRHAESFGRTFHRTMTQEASPTSVLGEFAAGATLDYGGVRARMTRGSHGEYLIGWSAQGGAERWQARVERTVGSHWYQQYLARDGDVWFRLPIAWDVAERRFIHMNGAFLTPDPVSPPAGAAIDRADYDRHVTRWNDNCVFCHNVRPNPGLDEQSGRFATEVAELGIACEACHGPGADHVAHNHDPLRRYALQVQAAADPTIRNPARMSAARSAEVCGRCHGQRITSDVGRFMRDGDRFVPGDPLAEQSTPLARDTTLHGEPGVFAPRFWGDGTPRLTAYEFQGLLLSPCNRGGTFSCESCHAMHRGDPRGQLRPERTGDAACTGCHTELAGAAERGRHSRHDASGAGARCAGCHTPDIVYGLISVRATHRVEIPDPAAHASAGRPDACTLCHVDEDRDWALREARRMFSQSGSPDAVMPPGLPEVVRQLLAGDPIERAVAAHALGKPAQRSRASHSARTLGLLADVMITDPYPAVRAIALRSLRARLGASRPRVLSLLSSYVATDFEPERRTVVARVLAALGDDTTAYPDVQTRAALRAQADRVAIEIGE